MRNSITVETRIERYQKDKLDDALNNRDIPEAFGIRKVIKDVYHIETGLDSVTLAYYEIPRDKRHFAQVLVGGTDSIKLAVKKLNLILGDAKPGVE
ncbi:MAG: hypothetical protein WC533_03090 [Candidatus Pacearchaeota archaeon]